MLILGRRKSEVVTLRHAGVEIHVIVVEVRGGHVRLGFDCPQEVTVHREEVQRAIDENKELA